MFSSKFNKKRRIAAIIISVLIIISTLFYVDHPIFKPIKKSIDPENTFYFVRGVSDITETDHKRGDKDADVVLIDYSDFSCIFCAFMQDIFERIAKEQKILIVSRHIYRSEGIFFKRALAAECVAKNLGEEFYFPYSNYLYKNQHDIDNSVDLRKKAIELGLNGIIFDDCVEGDIEIYEKVKKQSEDAIKLGAVGTPFIVVVANGEPIGISYANNYEEFLERIKILIQQRVN